MVEAPELGLAINAVTPVRVIAVLLHEADAPVTLGLELGVPLPCMVIPIPAGTVMFAVHVQEPGGMMMVSPLAAVCVGP